MKLKSIKNRSRLTGRFFDVGAPVAETVGSVSTYVADAYIILDLVSALRPFEFEDRPRSRRDTGPCIVICGRQYGGYAWRISPIIITSCYWRSWAPSASTSAHTLSLHTTLADVLRGPPDLPTSSRPSSNDSIACSALLKRSKHKSESEIRTRERRSKKN